MMNSTPARGTELAERLIKQDRVKFMLGPYSSGLTKAILPVIEKHGVPMVEGNGAARELFTKGYRYIFAVLSTSDQYLTSAIELAAENATSWARSRTRSRLRWRWRTIPSPKMFAPAFSTTLRVTA